MGSKETAVPSPKTAPTMWCMLSLDGYYRVLSTLNTLPVTSNRVLGEGRRVVVRSQGSLLAAHEHIYLPKYATSH